MRLTDVQRNDLKDSVITVRTTKDNANWLRKNKVSPSLLFDHAVKELMDEVVKQEEAEENLKKFASPKNK